MQLTDVAETPLLTETCVARHDLRRQEPVRLDGANEGARRETSHCLCYAEPRSELDDVDPEASNALLNARSRGRDHPLSPRARNATTELDQHTALRPLRRADALENMRRSGRQRGGSRGALRNRRGKGRDRYGYGRGRGDYRASHNHASAALSDRGGFPITQSGAKCSAPTSAGVGAKLSAPRRKFPARYLAVGGTRG